MLAVSGGASLAVARGSAFSRSDPSAPSTSYLYLCPARASGTKISHTPETPSVRIGWTRPSQPFHSPTTRTARAEGAHTANAVPSTP